MLCVLVSFRLENTHFVKPLKNLLLISSVWFKNDINFVKNKPYFTK